MKIVAPDFYPDFRCRMGACRHTCCAHWEIDVDAETLARYQAVTGPFASRLAAGIDAESGGIRLAEGERCPFLNNDGLCEIILHLGEGALCQVCADHPRYRSFFSDRTEVGLGLCCEAAASLVLGHVGPWRLITIGEDGEPPREDEEEARLTALRDALFEQIGSGSAPVSDQVDALDVRCGVTARRSLSDWASFLLTLERLDERWTVCLMHLQDAPPSDAPQDEQPLRQLYQAMLHRHLPRALEDGDASGWLVWVNAMWRVVCAIARQTGDLPDAARLWSAEIEYSAENVEEIKRACEG